MCKAGAAGRCSWANGLCAVGRGAKGRGPPRLGARGEGRSRRRGRNRRGGETDGEGTHAAGAQGGIGVCHIYASGGDRRKAPVRVCTTGRPALLRPPKRCRKGGDAGCNAYVCPPSWFRELELAEEFRSSQAPKVLPFEGRKTRSQHKALQRAVQMGGGGYWNDQPTNLHRWPIYGWL